jgi:predicted transcriptional regulator
MAKPKGAEDDRVSRTYRLTPEVDERIKRLASERQVAANLIVTWALEAYLDNALPVDELK